MNEIEGKIYSYLKKQNNLYYRITTGECVAINTDTQSVKKLASFPSGYCKDFLVITKEIFQEAYNSLNL